MQLAITLGKMAKEGRERRPLRATRGLTETGRLRVPQCPSLRIYVMDVFRARLRVTQVAVWLIL